MSVSQEFLQQVRLYEDDDILVIIKPSGVLSVPGKGDLTDSVLTRLQAADPTIRLVHRLDRDTSGILIFAHHLDAQRHLSRQFELRETQKKYQALLLGEVIGEGVIDVPVRYDPTRPPMHIVDTNYPKQALTHWQALPSIDVNGQAVTPVWFKPITGRSHQLRVHSVHLGHPILGDALYADPQGLALWPRLALHSAYLSFRHPCTEEPMSFAQDADFWHVV